jgi:hypothetical protein
MLLENINYFQYLGIYISLKFSLLLFSAIIILV